jgi:UDP-N-acetylmuramoyl-tripeptide--D-alanyl-D-alanine ligase
VVAAAHTQVFGSIDDVARAKAELVVELPSTGTAVLNADDDRVAAMARHTAARVLTFGQRGDVRAVAVRLDDELRPAFRLESPWGEIEVQLAARGLHQVHNALAAASAGLVADVDLDTVAAGLAAATLSPWRMELHRAASGAVVLNDAYNANPTSMAAALRSLVALPARRHLAVLGVMAELGPSSAADHATIAELAAQLGVTVVSVGAPAYGVTDVDDPDRAVAELGPLGPDDAVLVKGSRVAGLEAVAERLLAG